jgi:hypothetical protein
MPYLRKSQNRSYAIEICIEFEAKCWNHLLVESFDEAKHCLYLLLHHMIIPKSKFFFQLLNDHLLILDFSKVQN